MPTIQSPILQGKLYTVSEAAELLRKSTSWVSREFRNYPGVVRSSRLRLGKRPYVTLLIPELVLQRWIREHTAPDPTEKRPLLGAAIEP